MLYNSNIKQCRAASESLIATNYTTCIWKAYRSNVD